MERKLELEAPGQGAGGGHPCRHGGLPPYQSDQVDSLASPHSWHHLTLQGEVISEQNASYLNDNERFVPRCTDFQAEN